MGNLAPELLRALAQVDPCRLGILAQEIIPGFVADLRRLTVPWGGQDRLPSLRRRVLMRLRLCWVLPPAIPQISSSVRMA